MTAPPEQFPETYLLQCVGCGYALRGLPPESRCPECGLGIRQTLAAVARRRHPWPVRVVAAVNAYFRRALPALARNSRPWLRTVAVAPVSLALLIPVGIVWSWWRETVPWQLRVPEYPLVWMALTFAAAVWLLTWPDRPRQRPVDPLWTSIRWALRAVSLSPILAALRAAHSEVVPAHEHWRYARQALELVPLTPVIAFLLFDYLAYLSARAWSEWAAAVFRASMMVVTPLLTVWAWFAMGLDGGYEPRRLYPDGAAALFATARNWIGGVYAALLFLALLRLAAAMWSLANDPAKR